MKKLESLDITFENCEFATFSAADIALVRMDNISESMLITFDNTVYKSKSAGSVMLKILQSGNRFCETECDPKKPKFIFQRIMERPDITHIDLTYSNKKTESYSVSWEDADEVGNKNKFQKAELLGDGTLIIIIFDTEELEDA